MYDIHDGNAFRYKMDTLQHFKKISLDDSLMHHFLRNAKAMPKDQTVLWMGLYVATCRFDDSTTRKIDISVYGGFFFDEQTRTYYEVPPVLKEDWLHYFHDQLAAMQQIIIP